MKAKLMLNTPGAFNVHEIYKTKHNFNISLPINIKWTLITCKQLIVISTHAQKR